MHDVFQLERFLWSQGCGQCSHSAKLQSGKLKMQYLMEVNSSNFLPKMPRGASCVFLLHFDEYFHVAQVRAFNGVSTAKMPSIQYQYIIKTSHSDFSQHFGTTNMVRRDHCHLRRKRLLCLASCRGGCCLQRGI